MKVLVYSPFALYSPHIETELEIMQRHLDDGDEVQMLGCDAQMLACDANLEHALPMCWHCMGCRRHGLSLLSQRVAVRSFLRLTDENRAELAALPAVFGSLDELKALKVDRFDAGMAVLSSVISLTRNPCYDVQANAVLVRDFLLSAVAIYRSLQNLLAEEKFDRVYIFNGRWAALRAAVRACQHAGVEVMVHDRGCDLNHFACWKGTTSHDIGYMEKWLLRHWTEAAGRPDREQMADQFFLERAKGVVQSWYSYVKDQKQGLLPEGWDPKKKNIVIFNSSEDEFVAMGEEWKNPLYDDQLDGLSRLRQSLAADPAGLHVYLRMHPNNAALPESYKQRATAMNGDFMTVIAPEAPVSTYEMLRHADVVVSFGSTMGIEAVYWGKPSVLAGKCIYRNLGGTYNPASHEELVALLKADLKPKDREPALMYGYFWKTFGTPFKYFKPTAIHGGEFKGTRVKPAALCDWLLRLYRHLHWRIRVRVHRLALRRLRRQLMGENGGR